MAGGSLDENDDGITDINVTPLVDVVLVLLIIFMVTTSVIINRSIEVNLPEAETADNKVEDSESVDFTIDANSNLFLNGESISLPLLPSKLDLLKQEHKQINALISADEKTPHGSVVQLIDALKKNGILNFALNVEVKAPTASPSGIEDQNGGKSNTL